MKTFVTIIFLIICLCYTMLSAFAATVDVWWDPNTEADMQGYRVYLCASNPCQKSASTMKVDVLHPKTSASFEATQSGNVAVTAYDTTGNESEFSKTLPFVVGAPENVPPVAPKNPNVYVH